MKTELSDNDRQRIEQEAIIYTDGHGSTHKNWRGFLKGAEYATLFERQQQFQKVMDGPYVDFDKPNIFMDGDNNSYSLMTSSDPEKREKGRQIRIHELVTRINQLEAERSEVVSLLKEYANDTGAVDTNLKARVKMYLTEHKL